MSSYKRGDVYWYKFMWHGELIRKSTEQGNDKVARNMEAAHRTRLAKEHDERNAKAEQLGCPVGQLAHCPECNKWYDSKHSAQANDGKDLCSDSCRATWDRKSRTVPTLRGFCEQRVELWAKVRPSWPWFRSGIRPLLDFGTIAGMKLDSITSETVADYAAHRQAHGLQAGTINRELRVLRRALRLAVEWGLLERAPKVQMLRGEKRRERVIADAEFAKYVTCASPLLAEVATVLADTGMRPDECYRMCWEDVTWINGRNGSLLVRQGKTAAARRVLPMTPRVREVLELRWERAGKPAQGWVWPAPTKSGHINHSSPKKQHAKALKLSGVRPFVLYSFRHTFATRIAPRVDAWTLCKIMGWSSLSVAMTYIHPSEDRVLDAFSSVGGHKIGHSDTAKELPAPCDVLEVAEA